VKDGMTKTYQKVKILSFIPRCSRKEPLGRAKCKWKLNTKIALEEILCTSSDLIQLAQNRDK
jgi:hypothetical protein